MNDSSMKPDWRKQFDWTQIRKHNDLFRPGENGHFNACVGHNGGPYELDDYAHGYFEAAERLVHSIVENRSHIDLLIYPLVFNYRHALELGLKYLATTLPVLANKAGGPKFTHRLTDNWAIVKPLLQAEPEFEATPTVEPFEKILTDFVELDGFGETFRFPSDRSNTPHLRDTSHINILVLGETMEVARSILSFWMDTADVIRSGRKRTKKA